LHRDYHFLNLHLHSNQPILCFPDLYQYQCYTQKKKKKKKKKDREEHGVTFSCRLDGRDGFVKGERLGSMMLLLLLTMLMMGVVPVQRWKMGAWQNVRDH
jgi:hypothetical protein